MLREPLQPGQSVKFSIRLQGSQSTTISLLDEQHERRASFAFYGFRDSQQLLIRMNIEQDNMPMGAAPLATELDWTNIKISVMSKQIWFYVNGRLRGFRHLDKEVRGWHLQIDEVRSTYLQIKDFFVTKMDNETRQCGSF